MKPFIHATNSAKKFGGRMEDYLDLHEKMDSSKKVIADMRHRAIYHHSMGIYILADFFGHHRINSDGLQYSVRDILEQHVLEDLGQIPTVERWYEKMPLEAWMGNPSSRIKTIKLFEPDNLVD